MPSAPAHAERVPTLPRAVVPRRAAVRGAALLACAALAAACAGRRAAPGGPRPAYATNDNRNSYYNPVTIYASVGNAALGQRIGQVQPTRVEQFRLEQSLLASSGTLTFIAIPVGGNGRASTGPLVVRGGDIVQFNLAADLRVAAAYIR